MDLATLTALVTMPTADLPAGYAWRPVREDIPNATMVECAESHADFVGEFHLFAPDGTNVSLAYSVAREYE